MVELRAPVNMKVITAAKDLLLLRARPQIPCPEVQPLPSFDEAIDIESNDIKQVSSTYISWG